MDDKFLYLLREQPDLEFAKNLHQKLTQSHSDSKWMLNINLHTIALNRKAKLGWITVLIAVGIIALMTISPVRAFVSSLIIRVAGQLFEVTEDYPGDNYPGDETIIEPQEMSLSDALELFPQKIKLPTNIPTGIVMDEENIRVYIGEEAGPFADTIEIDWVSDTSAGFTLRITNHDWSIGEIVAPDSVEEIFLDDNHPAVVIRGGWDADEKAWNNDYGNIRLRWLVDDLPYELLGTNLEQLIEIALSTLE
jgi:hypothetical protein